MNLRFYCLPYAGASAMSYLYWKKQFPQWLELKLLELPGRGMRFAEPLVGSFAELVRYQADEIQSELELSIPYILFGHSLGALLAFELARTLKERNAPLPKALFVAGTHAPSQRPIERFASLQSDAELIEELKRLNGTAQDVFANQELMAMILPILRADFQLCASYRYQSSSVLPFPIHAFGGKNDEVTEIDLMAWHKETSSVFTLDMLDGDHFFIHRNEASFLNLLRHYTAGYRVDERLH
jgi:surfactin synthase thioesterase subunit